MSDEHIGSNHRLVWSTRNMMPLCSICDERNGYGDPCDECLDASIEFCPKCYGEHSTLEQMFCEGGSA